MFLRLGVMVALGLVLACRKTAAVLRMERVGRLQLLARSSTLLVWDKCKLLVHLRLELLSPCVLLPPLCQ